MVLDVIILVLIADIALSLRRLLHGGTPLGVTWTWLYPLDWLYLVRRRRK